MNNVSNKVLFWFVFQTVISDLVNNILPRKISIQWLARRYGSLVVRKIQTMLGPQCFLMVEASNFIICCVWVPIAVSLVKPHQGSLVLLTVLTLVDFFGGWGWWDLEFNEGFSIKDAMHPKGVILVVSYSYELLYDSFTNIATLSCPYSYPLMPWNMMGFAPPFWEVLFRWRL